MINVIFVCLLSCCSWFMPLKDNLSCENQDQIQEVERKTRNDMYNLGGYTLLDVTDVLSFNFLYQLNPTLFNNPYHYDFNEYSFVHESDYVRLIQWNKVNPTLDNLGFSTGGGFTEFSFTYSDTGTQSFVTYYDYTFRITDGYNGYTGKIGCYSFNSSSNTESFGIAYVTYTRIGQPSMIILDNSYTYLYDMVVNTNNISYQAGYQQGYQSGFGVGEQHGYAEGVSYGQSQSSTAVTIFTGILEVGLLPVNVFLKMFEYEVFGINIAGLISGILTIAMIMILVRFIFGGKEK